LKETVCKYWADHSPSQPTISAQLLGQPASGKPYTIPEAGKSDHKIKILKIGDLRDHFLQPRYDMILDLLKSE
jgi:hypothetical protein